MKKVIISILILTTMASILIANNKREGRKNYKNKQAWYRMELAKHDHTKCSCLEGQYSDYWFEVCTADEKSPYYQKH